MDEGSITTETRPVGVKMTTVDASDLWAGKIFNKLLYVLVGEIGSEEK